MRCGYFDDSKGEYIINNPITPVKWINYIGSIEFGGFVDHTGGALICRGDPALNRITKYIPQLPDSSMKGETLYLRFMEDKSFKIFSPFYTPTLDPYDKYECHVGLSYTRILSEFYGIRTDVTIFIPFGSHRVIRSIKITNISDRIVSIDVIPVVEYTHFDALKQFTNADWVPQTMQSKIFNEEGGLKVLTQFAFMNKDIKINYFTSNFPISSFESDRRNFLGNYGYGSWTRPFSLLKEELGNTEAQRGDNIAVLMHHLGKLKPGETRRLVTQLGQAESVEKALPEIQRYRKEHEVDSALDDIIKFWDKYLSRMQVETPDELMNSMLNIHNPRQCYITKNWSRYLSLYQLGLGDREMGFRDSSQDVMGILMSRPYEGKTFITKLLHIQKRDGCAMHQFNPLSMGANEGDLREKEDSPNYYSDDHLWVVLSTVSYLKETDDLDFLNENIPFYDRDNRGSSLDSGTVLEHLMRAIEFTRSHTGAHGLPLLGFADWNDTVNLNFGAESLFVANLYGLTLREMMDLMEHMGDQETLGRYREYYEEMKKCFNQCSWDGKWFIRYFDCEGLPIGSNTNTEGSIYANAQSWPVISGFAPPDRAKTALDSVHYYLNTKKGIKLCWPCYNRYNPEMGGVTTYPPGAKENGGIFLQTNPWMMMAEVMLGNGDRAFQYYNQINPSIKNNFIEEYECEPYCYAQNILGDEHPQFGLARNSWLSGTASWVYQAGTKYILGIMPTFKGLHIDPCIPHYWEGFRVKRWFRNAMYEIKVKNPTKICKGINTVTLDGSEIEGNIIPIFNDGKKHIVNVLMG
jgi:cellobiose phosphorylase